MWNNGNHADSTTSQEEDCSFNMKMYGKYLLLATNNMRSEVSCYILHLTEYLYLETTLLHTSWQDPGPWIICLTEPANQAQDQHSNFWLWHFRHTHVLLQLGLADVGEAEGKQCLPGSDVQHVVFLAEQQRCVIEDAVHRKSLGWSLLCIWKQQENKHIGDLYHIAGQHREEKQIGTEHVLMLEAQEHKCAHLTRWYITMITILPSIFIFLRESVFTCLNAYCKERHSFQFKEFDCMSMSDFGLYSPRVHGLQNVIALFEIKTFWFVIRCEILYLTRWLVQHSDLALYLH